MWFEQSGEMVDILRSSLVAYLFLVLPIVVSLAPGALAAKDFHGFRLQQFELHGTSYGTTGSVLNFETRILPGSQIVSSPRRCYLVKLVDLTIGMYRDLLKYSVAGIVIIVPSDLAGLSPDMVEGIQHLEQVMIDEATAIPVYFIKESDDVLQLYETVKQSAESLGSTSSAFQTLLHHIHGNGVQLVTGSSIGTPKIKTDAQVTSIQGALIGSKSDKNFPILVSAHYDSMSPAAELSFGADSNASGATILLELARIFSHLYSQQGPAAAKIPTWSNGRPHSSLLFLLSGAGEFNYHGTQKYLEDQVDSSENSDLQDTRLVVCLDSLAGTENRIYIHVSRSIREGTMLNTFIRNLIEGTKKLYPEMKVDLVQRKVRTEALLSWEHEKFHLKKINAITLSSYEDPDQLKSSLLDTRESINVNDLAKKTHAVAEALAASIYNVSGIGTAFSGSLSVSKESVSSLLDYIGSESRSAQLLANKQNKFVLSLRSLLARYTHETSLFHMKPDKRDANLVFYDTTGGIITAYDVKPAVFDLVLSIAIFAYIALIYSVIKHFSLFYEVCSYKRKDAHAGANGTATSQSSQKLREKAQ